MGFHSDREPLGDEQQNRDAGSAGVDEGVFEEQLAPVDADGMVDADALSDMQAFRSLEDRRKKKQHQKRVRLMVALGVIAVLVVCGIAWYNVSVSMLAAVPTGDTATVSEGDFTDNVSSSGTLQPISATIVTPEVDGIIESINVAAGTTVNAGDTLFTLKNDQLDKAVTQASQQVKTAQNGVSSAQVALQAARNSYANAKDTYEASKTAAGSPAVPGAGVTTSPTFDESSLNDAINQAQVALNGAYIGLETAQQAYDDAVATAAKRTVTAAVSGNIIAMNAEVGKQVGSSAASLSSSSSSPLIEIADLSQMKVTIQVNEVDISKVVVGQTAKVTFPAVSGLTLDATVHNISTIATTSSSSALGGSTGSGAGVVTYAVELVIAKPDPRLKPGMTATVSVTTDKLSNVLTVPVAAVQSGSDGKYLNVVTDTSTGASEARKVTVKAQNSTSAVVEGDISAGDTILISSVSPVTASASGL